MNHDANNQRVARRRLRAEKLAEESRDWWTAQIDTDQARYRAIANRYADRNGFCRTIAERGGGISRRQAAILLKIEGEQGR